MDMLVSAVTEMWDFMSPTTWLMVLGLLVSVHLLGRALD